MFTFSATFQDFSRKSFNTAAQEGMKQCFEKLARCLLFQMQISHTCGQPLSQAEDHSIDSTLLALKIRAKSDALSFELSPLEEIINVQDPEPDQGS